MKLLQFAALCSTIALVNAAYSLPVNQTVTIRNGTLAGKYLPTFDQDAFLGIPFAQPPVGPLRFRWPQSINSTFNGTYDATKYGYSCYQYGTNFNLSEDCLTLNVVRPTGAMSNGRKLPVLVWIYGGGLYAGSTADPQYNISGIVRNSQDTNTPVIGVSINYRLGVWGFLQSPQVLAEGSSNAGLLDQRMALRWIQENIGAFGGDPEQVTIWGESAGAQSIGLHLHSYGGRDDGLYSAAIMESGGPVGAFLAQLAYYAAPVENLTRTTGCYTSSNQLACLRNLSSAALFNAQVSQTWNPIVDGDFLTAYPSDLTAYGSFVKVPIITGANSDEGTSFSTHGLDNETAIFQNLLYWRSYALSPPTIRRLLDVYPNDPANEPPYYIQKNQTYPPYGLQWRRDAAIGGDLVMVAQRRKMAEAYTRAGLAAYSYRFDTPAWNASTWTGANHFVNVMFSFQNISGNLGPIQSYKNLSTAIGRAYIAFVNSKNPNPSGGNATDGVGLPYWPKYDLGMPTNVVMNSNRSYVEADTFRRDGIAFINTIDRELLS